MTLLPPNSPPRVDYQEALRDIAKTMVRLKKPDRLLKLITRFIDAHFQVDHTSLLVLDADRERYIFVDSKGSRKVPTGLVKFDHDHPLVRWFGNHRAHIAAFRDHVSIDELRARIKKLQTTKPAKGEDVRQYLALEKSMEFLKAHLAIPGYFKNTLQGLLILGARQDGESFSLEDIRFFQTLAQDCSMAVKTAEYHQNLISQNEQLEKQLHEIERLRLREQKRYYEIIRSLAQQVHAKDADTFGHIDQVEKLGLITARELRLDLKSGFQDILSAGLLLHDVGKIGIPDHILNKPAHLNDEEWNIMQSHVEKGARILEPLGDFKEVREIVLSHHENWDGTGYPRGLKGDEIPIGARIVAVVDSFHAIISVRCYCESRSVSDAFEELRRCSGTQFDETVVEAFIKGLEKEMEKRGCEFFLHSESGEAA